jgi:1-acyl-sn-glycerol-3-phosphate acyltransferase
LYYRLAYHHKVYKSGMKGICPPYLVVAGHSCWLDYIISSVSMFPVRMNFVGAYNFFRNRLLKSVFTMMGVIPKHQYTSDTVSIRKIKYCIDQGRAVALFPHGCLSNEGRPGGFAVFGVAKLIKFLNVPVVALKTDGGYLTRPRWSGKSRYGRIETTIRPVLTVEEIQTLSTKEIYRRLMDAIDFDDYKWQRERMIPYRSKEPALGVEYVLYKCPKCQSEFTLRSGNERLYCEFCGNAVRMNRYLLFEPEAPDTVCFDGIDRWYDYQSSCLDKEIEDTSFELTANTELLFAEPDQFGYQHQGFGVLRLTRDAITYAGDVKGEKKSLVLPMKNIPMIPYAANEYIEVAVLEDIHRFVLEDRRQMIKWVMAVRQIRDKYYEEAI